MSKFLFIDLETTGLNEQECQILEVAAIITDSKLNILEEYSAPIRPTDHALSQMDEWCRTTHTQSGLLEAVHECGIEVKDAEIALQRLKRKHFPVNKPAVGGSSVHFDKKFIDKHMPNLSKELSHRIIDVSSFMGALSTYHNFTLPPIKTDGASHRALADIRDSITYLKSYLEKFKI